MFYPLFIPSHKNNKVLQYKYNDESYVNVFFARKKAEEFTGQFTENVNRKLFVVEYPLKEFLAYKLADDVQINVDGHFNLNFEQFKIFIEFFTVSLQLGYYCVPKLRKTGEVLLVNQDNLNFGFMFNSIEEGNQFFKWIQTKHNPYEWVKVEAATNIASVFDLTKFNMIAFNGAVGISSNTVPHLEMLFQLFPTL